MNYESCLGQTRTLVGNRRSDPGTGSPSARNCPPCEDGLVHTAALPRIERVRPQEGPRLFQRDPFHSTEMGRETRFNLLHRSQMPKVRHVAAKEEPNASFTDVREISRPVRSPTSENPLSDVNERAPI